MKVLVATNVRQGERVNDFHWCVEGELVWVGLACDTDRRNPDGGCGCGRGFGGLSSHRATTTARVAELPLSRDEYVQAVSSSLGEQGWGAHHGAGIADELAALVADWPVGTIVERRLDTLRVRWSPTPVKVTSRQMAPESDDPDF